MSARALLRVLLPALLLSALALPAPAAEFAGQKSEAGRMASDLYDSLARSPQGRAKQQPAAGRSGPQAPAQPSTPVAPETRLAPAGGGSSLGSGSPAKPPANAPGNAPTGSPLSSAPAQPSAAPEAQARPFQAARPGKAEPAQARGEAVVSIEHDGRERRALAVFPAQRAQAKGQPKALSPALIFLHGAGGSARQAMRQTGLAAQAARAGFIAVFPEGLSGPAGQNGDGLQTWNAWMCCGYARDAQVDDVGYLSALIRRLTEKHGADPRRIHLAGFSNGAMLASRFALERPGVAASIASVAGYLPCDAQAPQEALPVLVIHGNRDQVARFGPNEAHPRTGRFCEDYPAKAQVEFWVRGMGLAPRAQQVLEGRRSPARLERYGPAKSGRALVEFVIVKGGGHAWPGGANERYRYCDLPLAGPDASAMVLDFFRRTPKPAPKAAPAEPKRRPKTAKGRG